ncbi:voltage-dependent calcium channel gamma-7 subunit [Amia ocellicauda]|uniref:voltage-dependent calcium channel gamma-7 subunit n=1 Tax=Amia ocellicauda TaxID=2972642 RepID=UPI003464C848
MSSCSSRALTLLSSVFGASGLLLVGVAVSTDYWLLMEEGIVLQQNQSTEVKMALHSGLWRVCFIAGAEKGRCVASEYFTEPEIEITTENTANILKMVRTATPFPMVSLLFVFTAFVISNIGHIRPQRTILAFISGIFFILSGLSLVVGLVLYISSINDEVMNRPREPEQFFHYHYGWSFAFAASSFLLKEGAGVMSVYLFMKRYAEEEMYRPHPALYRPRLSDCSDYSGQFLHPSSSDWPPPSGPAPSASSSTAPPPPLSHGHAPHQAHGHAHPHHHHHQAPPPLHHAQRGRSSSEVSSDISIQLNQQTPPPQAPPLVNAGGTLKGYSGGGVLMGYQLPPPLSSSSSLPRSHLLYSSAHHVPASSSSAIPPPPSSGPISTNPGNPPSSSSLPPQALPLSMAPPSSASSLMSGPPPRYHSHLRMSASPC